MIIVYWYVNKNELLIEIYFFTYFFLCEILF